MTDDPFAGVYPAMTTPFHADGSIDFETLREDAQRLEAAGVDGLVPCGSTGESATMSHEEHIEVVEAVVDAVADVPVIAGSGSNNTREAVELSERSADAGADALLLISPYYNKPEPAGMEDHFRQVADAVDLPQIVYNVPSRTGRNIEVDTVANLASHPNISGYKAASGDMNRITEVAERTRDEAFSVLAGDDGMTLPIASVGGTGVISVAANVAPRPMSDVVWPAIDGDFQTAREAHHALGPLFRALFWETNPIPVKEAMHIRYGAPPTLRSPLSRLSEHLRGDLADVLSALPEAPATA